MAKDKGKKKGKKDKEKQNLGSEQVEGQIVPGEETLAKGPPPPGSPWQASLTSWAAASPTPLDCRPVS